MQKLSFISLKAKIIFIGLMMALPLSNASAEFIDLVSITDGNGSLNSSFTGTLGNIDVTGFTVASSISGGVRGFSTLDETSPQFGYASSFSDTQALGDAIGYVAGSGQTVSWTINFSAPVTNLVFHVAELDGSSIDFAPQGLSSSDLSILNSNGNLSVSGVELFGGASVSFPVELDPINAESAYGSLGISGIFSTLTFTQTEFRNFGDGGRFQFTAQAVSAPAASALFMLCGLISLVTLRRKSKMSTL